MKKFIIFIIFAFALNAKAISKETTYSKDLFDKALLLVPLRVKAVFLL